MISPRRQQVQRPIALAVAGLAIAASSAAAEQVSDVDIGASDARIARGQSVELRGSVSPKLDDRRIELKFKTASGDYDEIDQTRTDGEGDYNFEVTPNFTGRYRAVAVDEAGDKEAESGRADVKVDATLTARTRKDVLRGKDIAIRGRLSPSVRDRKVTIQRQRNGDWDGVATARTDGDGAYRAEWTPNELGSFPVRAKFEGDDLNGAVKRQVEHRVHVYRSAVSSWYGPGLYGNTTACGQTLRPDTVGVAHKQLPCGTKVRFHYRGETEKIRVIDRGPFIAGREWDLTEAAKRKLDFPDLDEIWSTR